MSKDHPLSDAAEPRTLNGVRIDAFSTQFRRTVEAQAYAAQQQALHSAFRTTRRFAWCSTKFVVAAVRKGFWFCIEFWNIPPLGPSVPQR